MKLGLVCQGGASRTIFSCGILDALLDNNITADYVIGASAGISYAVSYCSKQKGRNREITEKYMNDPRYMGVRHLLNRKNRSYYNLPFVFEEVPEKLVPFDFKAYSEFEGNIIAAVTNIETGEAEYLELERGDKKFMSMRASCALPLLFQPIEVNGSLYLDGGICDSIPFQKALDDGCDKVIVILTRPRGFIKAKETGIGAMARAYRKYPLLVNAMRTRHENYNMSTKKLDELEKQGKAYIIAPKDTHGIKRTEKKPEILLPFYDEGVREGERVMAEIKSFVNM